MSHRPLALALTLSVATLIGPVDAQQTVRSSPEAQRAVPHFHANANAELVQPPRESLVNANGTPRVLTDEDYERFWRDVAPSLEAWARDPRLNVNPAYVAALLAKESGFEPLATSWTPANGYAQLTHIADADMLAIARESTRWSWMLEELERWPRHPLVHRPDAEKTVTDSLTASGTIHAGNEYFFDPLTATRGAVFWIRLLAEVWSTDEFPGRYGSFARERLGGGNPLSEQELLSLVTVSYNRGYTYVRDLVERHGTEWTEHVNEEAADHLERIRFYTTLFQG